LAFIFAVSLGAAPAAALATEHDGQLWIKLGVSAELADGIDLELETNQRFSEDRDGHYESQYLAVVGVEIAEGVTLTAGVNRVLSLSESHVLNTEWRPRQQVSFPIAPLGRGRLAGRVRLEQRFRSDGDDVGHRVRPKISYTLPLRDRVAIKFAHESYLNLNTTDFGQEAGYERMRNSVALTFPIGGSVEAEFGYLSQHRFNGDDPDLIEHVLTTGLSVAF
jgi:hypothetical protein